MDGGEVPLVREGGVEAGVVGPFVVAGGGEAAEFGGVDIAEGSAGGAEVESPVVSGAGIEFEVAGVAAFSGGEAVEAAA